MKKKIRHEMFDSNSSSLHSLSIKKPEKLNYKTLVPDEFDNFVHIPFGEFGWEIEDYNSAYSKLSYILTMIYEIEHPNNEKDFYEAEDFKTVDELIKEKLHCNGVVVEDNFELRAYEGYNGQPVSYMEIDGYIDHQSYEDYESIQDFLDEYGVSLEDFIFNQNVVLHTDNDNH